MTRALARTLALGGWLACALPGACMRPAPSYPGADARGAPRSPATNAPRALGASELRARGIALLHAGDGLRAEQYLTLAVRAGAPESSAIVPLVQACVGSSRLQSALAHALPYLNRHPDAWRLRQLVAAIQLALGRNEAALAELSRVLRDHPHAAGAHYLGAVIARDSLDDPGAASAAFAAYLRDRPTGEHAAEARAWLRDQPRVANPAAEPTPARGAQP